MFVLMLRALQEHGLLRGKNLGIDSSVMEANASLRALVHRNTAEQYWDYVKRLAAEQGIDPEDASAVRKFDRTRPGKGSRRVSWSLSRIRSILNRNTSRKLSERAMAPYRFPNRSLKVILGNVLSALRAQSRCLKFPSAAPARVQQDMASTVGRPRRAAHTFLASMR